MKNILKKLWDFILKILKKFWNYLSSSWEHVLIVVLVIICIIFLCKSCSDNKKINELQNELIENTDSVTVYKNKCSELYSAKETYITTEKELRKLNAALYEEVKKLKDNPIVVTQIQYVIKRDSIYVKDSVFVELDDTYKLAFHFSDDYSSIKGNTFFNSKTLDSHTLFDSISLWGNIYYDIIEKDKQLYTIARTDNPYMQINNLESALVNPENSKVLKKHFNKPWGIMIGIGPSLTVIDSQVKVYPSINLTFGYKLISLF